MNRSGIFAYGLVSYVIGLGSLIFFMLFMGSWDFMPIHINSKETGPPATAILTNLCLMFLFGLQHSMMARGWFKEILTKFLPPVTERSTYVLFSGVVMFLICFCWKSVDGTLWLLANPALRGVVCAIQTFGWGLLVLATFQVNHFELMGLQQVYFHFINKPEPVAKFTDSFLYGVVRHPIQLGVLVGIWAAPTMTMSHFLLAASMTFYVFVGLYFEEKDLVKTFGETYIDYQQRVPMVLPFWKPEKRLKASG